MPASIDPSLASPEQIAADLGRRLEALRLAHNLRREDLAAAAGVAPRTLARFESSGRATVETLIRLLTALQLGGGLETLVPEPSLQPIERLGKRTRPRQRARPKKAAAKPKPGWTWGDES